jgi:hypothetical protein
MTNPYPPSSEPETFDPDFEPPFEGRRTRCESAALRRRERVGAPHAAVLLALLASCGSADGDGLSGPGASAPDGAPRPTDTGVNLPASSFDGAPGSSNACAGISVAAENQRGPADIIFALDNSGSMAVEAAFVQEHMNGFSEQIVSANVDARVVVISGYPGDATGGRPGPPNDHGVCIDAPLGSGGCPTDDTNLPTFLHVDQKVDSNNALELMIGLFPAYRSSSRPEAQKHLVVVTDDESALSAAEATAQILALEPPSFDTFAFHGIFAFTSGGGDHCDGFAEAEGVQYRQLVEATGGVAGDLCLQDFKPVFDRLAQAVVGRAQLPCQLRIPPPPGDTVFDPALTNVEYASRSAASIDLARAVSASACELAVDGWAWHYDDEANPDSIVLCPAACAAIQADPRATVNVEFGCPTLQVLR